MGNPMMDNPETCHSDDPNRRSAHGPDRQGQMAAWCAPDFDGQAGWRQRTKLLQVLLESFII
jgi:hypothetical protein